MINLMNYWKIFTSFAKDPNFAPLISLFNTILIFATALVTYFAWRTAKKANEIQLLPLLAIYFKGRTFHDRKIVISNIGKTPAYDIKIESFTLVLTDIQNIWKLDLSIGGTNILIPKEVKDLETKAMNNGKPASVGDFMTYYLDPQEEHIRKRIQMVLRFKNAEGKNYYCKIDTGLGGLFVKSAKRLIFIRYLYLYLRKFREIIFIQRHKFLWKFTKPHIARKKT